MSADVAKAILAGAAYSAPKASQGGIELFKLAKKFRADSGIAAPDPEAWYAALDDADVESLIFVVAALTRGYESERDAARLMVERKLNAEMIEKMRDLEAASTRLQWVAIGVAVAIAAVQIAVAYIGVR